MLYLVWLPTTELKVRGNTLICFFPDFARLEKAVNKRKKKVAKV